MHSILVTVSPRWSATSDYRCTNLYPSNNPVDPLWRKTAFQPYSHVTLEFFEMRFDLHRPFGKHNAVPQRLPGRWRVTKLSGMGNLAFEFDIPNLRGASRPAEYARTADRS